MCDNSGLWSGLKPFAERRSSFRSDYNDGWMRCKSRIDALAAEIRSMVAACDPLGLLSYCHSVAMQHFRENLLGITNSESPRFMGEMRAAEYVQSIIIGSSPRTADPVKSDTEYYFQIIQKIGDLFKVSMSALLYADKLLEASSHPPAVDHYDAIQTTLCMYVVRGRRHIAYHKAYLSNLLSAHSAILESVYGIDAYAVIEGFETLVWFLMLGNPPRNKDEAALIDVKPLPTSSFDVEHITKWPKTLIDDLSAPCGFDAASAQREFFGWLFSDSAIKELPFVKVAGRSYAFSYHLVSDYFYRALQFAVTRRAKELHLKYQWKDNQCVASESFAAHAFEHLLPGCELSRNNFYSLKNGTEGENDLLVKFGDVVIIVEVKGAAFSHKSPLQDATGIISKYDHLRSAISQCRRTEEYIVEFGGERVVFWTDENKTTQQPIGIDGTERIFKIALTVDNVNEIASCASTLAGFAGDNKGVICLSIDDMIVYCNNFRGLPALFLHYLSVRSAATGISRLYTFDELDHLDAYSGNPHYVEIAEQCCGNHANTFVNMGAGCELDTTKITLPELPKTYRAMLDFLGKVRHPKTLLIVSALMSFDDDVRQIIDASIVEALSKSRRCGHAIAFRNPSMSQTGLFVTVSEGVEQLSDFVAGCRSVAQDEIRKKMCKRFFLLTIVFRGDLHDIQIEEVF